MTLVEILVATSIFIFLGAAAIGILRSGLYIWRSGEAKRNTFDTAQLVLSQISEDLRAVYTREPREDQPVHVGLLCDFDPNGRQRIRFVRTVAGATSPYTHKEAGSLLGADSDLDLINDYHEARMGTIRATGGLCEIAYTMSPGPSSTKLYRGMRAPIGGAGSFFNDLNLTPGSKVVQLADNVLYLGFWFWTQYTNTWKKRKGEEEYWPIINPRPRQKSGPAFWWDSTRSKVPPFELNRNEFTTYLPGAISDDPRDDIFPRAIRIELVVREGVTGVTSKLARDVDGQTLHIPVENPGAFYRLKEEHKLVRIDGEWIRFSDTEHGALKIDPDTGCRGARGTAATSHRRGALVEAGKTFTFTLRLPGAREDWNGK